MKLKVLIVLLGFGFSLLSFAAEPLENYYPQNDIPKYGKDSVTCVANLSLYREFYKQWKQSKYKNDAITDASRWWSWVYANCPRATENIYVDGSKMVKYRIKKAKDPELKMIWIERGNPVTQNPDTNTVLGPPLCLKYGLHNEDELRSCSLSCRMCR